MKISIKTFRRFTVYLVVKFFYLLLYFVPFRIKSLIGAWAGYACYLLMRGARKTAISNIRVAFPEKEPAEAKRIAAESFMNMGKNALETLHLPRLSREEIKDMAEFEGLDYFEEAMKQGRGLIALTGHIGNWEFYQAIMSARGFPSSVLAKRYSNPWIDKMITDIRETSGTKVIVRRRGKERDLMRGVLDALKNGHALGILIDHYTKKDGIAVPFLNAETSAPAGPAIFSARMGAPAIFGYAMRLGKGKFRVKFHPPVKAINLPDKEQSLYLTTSRFLGEIEAEIRENPAQWAWMHRFRRSHHKSVRRVSFSDIPKVEIYSKKECSLCDKAKELLREISVRYPFELKSLDITDDPEKLALFGQEVPVIFIDGKKLFKLQVDRKRFEEKIIERLASKKGIHSSSSTAGDGQDEG